MDDGGSTALSWSGARRVEREFEVAVATGDVSRRSVIVGMLLFAVAWLALLAYTSRVPGLDDLEQLTWVRSLEWGYYKHPPLPTWLLWVPVKVLGWSAWTVYAMGAATTLAALAIMWRLLAQLRGERYALVALMAAACITYYNGRLDYYNHEVVLMLVSAACAALAWQAFATGRLRWWLGLGLALGLGALTKYQIAVTLASIAAFAVQQRFWRDASQRLGLLLALLTALLVFSPHLLWLRAHDFAPISYAMASSLAAAIPWPDRAYGALHWLIDQVLNRALPALLLLLWVGWTARRAAGLRKTTGTPNGQRPDARAFLVAFGAVPLVFMPLVGLVAGAHVQLHWGTPYLLFAVPLVMELTPAVAWRQADPRTLLKAFVAIQGLLLVISLTTSGPRPNAAPGTHWRSFDAGPAAAWMAEPARRALGGPIRVLIGPPAESAALALALPEQPLVLIDGRLDHSPWVSESLISHCGAVELGETSAMPDGIPLWPAMPGWSYRVRPPTMADNTACDVGNIP